MSCTTKRIEQESAADRSVWLMGQHGPAIRFASIKDAAQRTGLPEERVRECCANNTRVGDLVFRFVKE